MIWDFILFFLGAGLATAACWWRWKSTADERSRLHAQIEDLKRRVGERFN